MKIFVHLILRYVLQNMPIRNDLKCVTVVCAQQEQEIKRGNEKRALNAGIFGDHRCPPCHE